MVKYFLLLMKLVVVGKKVRKAIADIGGMMPEKMPTPKNSLKELERERKLLENKETRRNKITFKTGVSYEKYNIKELQKNSKKQ